MELRKPSAFIDVSQGIHSGENVDSRLEILKIIHEVRVVCCDEDKRGLDGYYIVPAINFGLFNGYVRKNGVRPASKKDEATIRKALEGADICHFNFCGFLSARSVDIAHEMGIPCTASLHTQAENYTNHVGLMESLTKENTAFAIARLYERGGIDGIRYVEKSFVKEAIIQAALTRRDFSPITANFLAQRYGLKKEMMAYYRFGGGQNWRKVQ